MTLAAYTGPERAWVALQNPAVELANAIAGTEFVPQQLRGNPAAICAAILYGDEVGLGPMQSLAKIAVINGRPTLAAEAQRALILAAGHDLWIEENTTTRCTVAGRRRDSENTSRVTWTLDDAKRAGIAGKQPWRMYPRQMLMARATAELARAVFADAIGGLAATEELESEHEGAEPTVEQAKTGTGTRRRRRVSVSQPQTTAAAETPPEPERPPLPDDAQIVPGAAGDAEPPLAAGGDVAVEDPSGDVPGSAALMTDAQRRKMMALFTERGFGGRDYRLAFTRAIAGRDVESSSELTVEEASRIIDSLEGMGVEGGGET